MYLKAGETVTTMSGHKTIILQSDTSLSVQLNIHKSLYKYTM